MSDIAAILSEARAMAENLQTGTWVVRRRTDDGDGPPVWSEVWRGPGRLRAGGATADAQPRSIGQTGTVSVQESRLDLPVTIPTLAIGDVATCLDSLEPGMAGGHWRIEQPTGQREQATAARHRVRQLVGAQMPDL